MRKLIAVMAIAVVGVPAGALAAQASHPSTPANANANSHANGTSTSGTSSNGKGSSVKVLFVLHGTILAYTAGTSVSIMVSASNREASTLKTQTLVFPLDAKTKVTGTVALNDKGIVKVKAPKNASATALEALDAFQVVDQHATG